MVRIQRGPLRRPRSGGPFAHPVVGNVRPGEELGSRRQHPRQRVVARQQAVLANGHRFGDDARREGAETEADEGGRDEEVQQGSAGADALPYGRGRHDSPFGMPDG